MKFTSNSCPRCKNDLYFGSILNKKVIYCENNKCRYIYSLMLDSSENIINYVLLDILKGITIDFRNNFTYIFKKNRQLSKINHCLDLTNLQEINRLIDLYDFYE